MLGTHCIRLAFQRCLPLAFLASVVAAFKRALTAKQTTSTTSKWTSQLLMSNCLLSMPLEPQCMAVTCTWLKWASWELHHPISFADLGSMTSVLPLEPLAVSYTSTQAALVNTVSEIVQGIHLESWALSPSAPYLSSLFPQQVQAILNSPLWLSHSRLEGGRVLLSY